MKNFLAVVFSLLIFSSTSFAAEIPLRGVVEGFYGTPFTTENRKDLMKFCREHNLNAYIYAPKDDPYHRDKWRVPYPDEKINELQNLLEAANLNGVKIIFAISPGLDLKYNDEDFQLLLQKIDSVYKIGVCDFAIFFDDLKDSEGKHHENGRKQAAFLNKLYAELSERYSDFGNLITVPTEYFRLDMVNSQGKVNSYTKNFAATLDKKIIVLYTGDEVVCPGISDAAFNAANTIYGRNLGIWWNYPVNDYSITEKGNRNAKLALGAIERLPSQNVQAIFFNPMSQYELSKIALATGADYANTPETYDAETSWNENIDAQFGELADAMKIFAIHSRHMENSWAKCGPADAPEFELEAQKIISAFRAGENFSVDKLSVMIDNMEKAANTLLKNLPPEILAECKPQLEQFRRIARADKLALRSLRNKKLNPQLKSLREEIAKNENSAILSEKAALKFLDDTIKILDAKK